MELTPAVVSSSIRWPFSKCKYNMAKVWHEPSLINFAPAAELNPSAPNHLEWEYCRACNISGLCATAEPCCDVASLILLLVYSSLFCVYIKPQMYATLFDLHLVSVEQAFGAVKSKTPRGAPIPASPPPCCTGAFVLEVPSRDPDLSPSKFFWPSSRQTLHSNCSISSVSQGLTLATFPICC